jgi:hypothetical protein
MENPRYVTSHPSSPTPAYQVFILRMWQDQAAPNPGCWRFSLEDPRTSQRRGFASLESLAQFLEAQAGTK